jgi:hypothetical protein
MKKMGYYEEKFETEKEGAMKKVSKKKKMLKKTPHKVQSIIKNIM